MTTTPDARTRVLFVVPSLRRAGAETQVVDLVSLLSPTEFDKHLFSFEPQLDQRERLDPSVQFHHRRRHYRFDPRPALEIRRLIDQYDIEVLHCTLQFAILLGWIASRMASNRPRLVAAIHRTVNQYRKAELQDRILYRPVLKTCDKVVFVCKAQQDYWVDRYPFLSDNSSVIHNGIDTSRFSPSFDNRAQDLRQSRQIPANAAIIACIAGLRPEKGHHFLLDALSRLPSHVHLLLAGDGPELDRLKALAQSLDIAKRVHFLGAVSDVRTVLRSADVSVLASTAVETFSLAMLESMSMEVPVVASDIGGLAEAIEPGENGMLVQPGQVGELTDALRTVLQDEAARREMGNRARSLVESRFSDAFMTEKTAALLRRKTLPGVPDNS